MLFINLSQKDTIQIAFARALWERMRHERKQPIDQPIGPYHIVMLEVNLFTLAEFGPFVPWQVINRGPLSALVHPNTDNQEEDERKDT